LLFQGLDARVGQLNLGVLLFIARTEPSNAEEISMNAKPWIIGLAMLAASVATVSAQSLKEQLLGNWTLVSNTQKYQDGKEENSFGPKLKGQLILTPTGRFSLFLIGGDRPKTNEPTNPIGPAVAYFGTYSIGEADKSLVFHVEGSTNPNFEGTDQKATVTINGDDMSYVRAPIPSSKGPFVPTVTWKRAK
jgi:lipocalin-like protein